MLLQALALAWLSGSAVAALGAPPWLAVVAACFALPFVRSTLKPLTVILVLASAVALAVVALAAASWYRGHEPRANPGDISRFIDRGPVTVRGIIEGDRNERERTLLLRL